MFVDYSFSKKDLQEGVQSPYFHTLFKYYLSNGSFMQNSSEKVKIYCV